MKRALISVFDKTGIVEFSRELEKLGMEIISTGGTKRKLEESGVRVRDVSGYTGFPEMMDGRLKTLHPRIHGGLLGIRDNPEHVKAMEENGIQPIDMLVVNLYPFEKVVRERPEDVDNAIENIDIGGPAMIRSAAKNHMGVVVIVDPGDYAPVLKELKDKGEVSRKTRQRLAVKVFRRVADYNAEIDTYLSRRFLGEENLRLSFSGGKELKYGENPHQPAMWFRDPGSGFRFRQLHGKKLGFNNLMDTNSAMSLAGEFEEPVAVIIKHANPCGVAVGENLLGAYRKARKTDPVSAFGGIASFNREVGPDVAEEMNKTFVEVVVAPSFSGDALEELKKKKNLRLLEIGSFPDMGKESDYKKIAGGILVQDADTRIPRRDELRTVTEKAPTEEHTEAMLFGWKVLRYVKSNAIIFVGRDRTLAIGAGQMSRVDSVRLAVMKAAEHEISLRDSVMCSDAFFPFRDGIDEAAKTGAAAVIQPGGSVRDQESIDACNEHGMAMAFTGFRCFRH